MSNLFGREAEQARSSYKSQGDSSLLEDVGKGLLVGARRDLFIKPIIDAVAEMGGYDPYGLDEMEKQLQGKTASEVAAFVGEYGPTMLMGVGVFGAGKLAGAKAIQAMSKAVATREGKGMLAKLAAKTGLEKQVGMVAKIGEDVAGKAGAVQGIPMLQRTAEIATGNTALSTMVGLQEKARGKTDAEALRAAALTMAIGVTADFGLTVGGKLLTGKARAHDTGAINKQFTEAGPGGVVPKKVLMDQLKIRTNEVGKLNEKIQMVLGVDKQVGSLRQASLFLPKPVAATISDTPQLITAVGSKGGGPAYLHFLSSKTVDENQIISFLKQKFPNIKPSDVQISRMGQAFGEKGTQKFRVQFRKGSRDIDSPSGFREAFVGAAETAQATAKATVGQQVFKGMHPKLRNMPAEIQAKVAAMQRTKKSAFREIDELKTIIKNEGVIPYTSTAPYSPGTFRRLISQTGLHAWAAPESWFGAFGSSGNRIFTEAQRRVDFSEAFTRMADPMISTLAVKAYKGLGISSRQAKKGGFLDSSHIYETEGEDVLKRFLLGKGRTAQQADDVVDSYVELTKMYDVMQRRGARFGMKPRIELDGSQGVVRYHSHAALDQSDEALVEYLKKNTKLDEVEIATALSHRQHVDEAIKRKPKGASSKDPDPLVGIGGGTTPRVGPLDFDRVRKGSLKEKFEAGLPVNPNPFDTAYRVLTAAERRFQLDPLIGKGGRNIDALVKTIEAEGGDAVTFRTILDAVVGRKYYNEAMRKTANFMGGLQVTSKLPLAVFANITQPQNTFAMLGFKNSMKGYLNLTRKQNRNEFSRELGIQHHIVKGIGRAVDDEGLFLGPTEMLADWTLRLSQFDRVERWNRMHAGSAALVTLRDTVAKAEVGSLRGKNLDFGRRLMGELGIDLDDVVRRQKATGRKYTESVEYQKLERIAAIRGAQRTQFFPGKTRRPIFWSHPIGRTMFQFKTFTLGQSRFLRDAVLAEAAHGNIKPLATFLAVAPVSGELVGDARNFIKGKDRDTSGIMRYFDNVSYVGGWGIGMDVMGAARWGDLEGWFMGPTIGDFFSLTESLLQGNVQAILQKGANQPAFQAGRFLAGIAVVTAEETDKYLEDIGSIPEGEYQTLEDLRFQQSQRKR